MTLQTTTLTTAFGNVEMVFGPEDPTCFSCSKAAIIAQNSSSDGPHFNDTFPVSAGEWDKLEQYANRVMNLDSLYALSSDLDLDMDSAYDFDLSDWAAWVVPADKIASVYSSLKFACLSHAKDYVNSEYSSSHSKKLFGDLNLINEVAERAFEEVQQYRDDLEDTIDQILVAKFGQEE